ncbi:MAG: transcription-repair coupling factor [Pseudomonadota bacterium]
MTALKTIYGVPEGQDARFLATQARAAMADDACVVYIGVDMPVLSELAQQIAFFAPDVQICLLPPWDCLPYDRVSPTPDVTAARVAALVTLLDWQAQSKRAPRLLLTTHAAWGQHVMAPDTLRRATLLVRSAQKIDRDQLSRFLADNGYHRTDTVRDAGEYAMRGSIIDLFPTGYDAPVRIDMFGDEVETLKSFDPATQVSTGKLPELRLLPATEYTLDENSIQVFRTGYRALVGVPSPNDPLYAAVSEGRASPGIEHWLPLFHPAMATVGDYLPRGAAVYTTPAALAAQEERTRQITDFYQARKMLEDVGRGKTSRKAAGQDISLSGASYHPLPPERLYNLTDSWAAQVTQLISSGGNDDSTLRDEGARRGADFTAQRAQSGKGADVMSAVAAHIAQLRAGGRRVILASYTEGSRDRLMQMLLAAGFANLEKVTNFQQVGKLSTQSTSCVVLPLEHGFIAPDLAILTEQDILGDRIVRSGSARRAKAENILREVSSLQEGDLIVHADHGIGRFLGLETLKAGGVFHDCLKLEYDGGDKLYMPVENIDILSRFGSDEGTVALDRLGGAGWQARKARVKANVLEMAEGLLAIAAARTLREADKLSIPDTQYHDFVARFPYHETEDQLRAIGDVLDDLGKGSPMDRLVCGDVGFGKTEVALRAAYVAALAGAQVAVLAPTTLLARQHVETFTRRFAGSGLQIGQLSRMVNAADQKRTRAALADGTLNIVIGTHAILAESLKFAHLGLLIVDEEQKFGVKQKERLKTLKNTVHVLTLTATPIPRTLQMALTGVRDLSLMTTPPVDRLAIRTAVLPYDKLVIREAILREHYRGGQTFYVCPRITDMEELDAQLAELVPDVKRITAHGQMTPEMLEERMSAFYDGQYGILLATNIIESGLDIPTANTIIVHRADMFGLSQLYQMRGRVGRSKLRAYAYLTYPAAQRLNKTAQKRLHVMETLDTLGAGFQLASHDMDIRGAGNLLGDAQSGHIREVGVELYQKMLEEAVAACKAGVSMDAVASEDWSPQINLGMSVLIPESYVEDLAVRMSLYRRLAEMADAQAVEAFAAELIDRFGALRPEVENLLEVVKIKIACKALHIAKVEAGPRGAVIGFYKDAPPHPDRILAWLDTRRGLVKLRPDQKLSFLGALDTASQRVTAIRNLLRDLNQFISI